MATWCPDPFLQVRPGEEEEGEDLRLWVVERLQSPKAMASGKNDLSGKKTDKVFTDMALPIKG